MGRQGILAEPVSASTFKGKFTEHKEEMFQKAQYGRIAKFPIPLTLGAHVVLVKSPHILGSIRPCILGSLPSGQWWPFVPALILIAGLHHVTTTAISRLP